MAERSRPAAARQARQLVAPALLLLATTFGVPCRAETYDRVASLGESPIVAEGGVEGPRGTLIDLIRALDRATHTTTKVVVRPFARSLRETAAGHADFHFPLVENDIAPPPVGLAYVKEVEFGRVQFVVYSRKGAPLDAITVTKAKVVEVQAGHEDLFRFPVKASNCISCTLDKIAIGRVDALIASFDVVDPLLREPRFKNIHRARYKAYPVRALVPIKGDSTATRRYLIEGVTQLKKTGELWRITPSSDQPYVDWQP